jgi:hypothetical protein
MPAERDRRPKAARRVEGELPRCATSQAGSQPAGEVQNVTSAPADAEDKVRRFVEGMSNEERMLVVLKRELYEGSWEEMAADLKARLEGRPYIFKLAHRIADDLERIDRLMKFEGQSGTDLSDYVQLEP